MADHHNIINSCGRGRSKAQSNLQKILQTISGNQFSSTNSSIQSSQSTATFSELINVSSESDSLEMDPTKKVKFDVDLNLSPPPETETHQEDYQPPMAAEIKGAGEGCNATLRLEAGDSNEKIEADPHPDEEMSQREEKSKGIGKFEALLDVVQIVSGEGGSSSEPMETELAADGISVQRIAEEETEKAVAAAEEEEQLSVSVSVSPAPVMRTKRGRAQVLPYKYRDSVVEPIGNMSSRHRRSSSSSTHVPTKRGSR